MSEKPTYEELAQRVKELELVVSACKNEVELLSSFIKHSPIPAFVKEISDQESKILFASDNYFDLIGIPSSQMLGKTMHEIFPHELAEKLTREDIDFIQKGKRLKLDKEINGMHYIINKFSFMQGGNKYLAGYTVDITDQKRTEEELREREVLFRELYNNVAIGIAIYETPDDGKSFVFKELNRHGLESGQIKKEDVIGREIRDIFPGVVAFGLLDVLQSVWKTGKPRRLPNKIYQDDKISLWVENYVFKLPSGLLVAMYEDTTAKRQAEAAKDVLEKQLVQAQKMESIGRLAGGVAHDFNNMLSVIIGHAEMALEDMDPSLPSYEKLNEIKKAGERSADLTRQLLAFARKQTISPKVVDLNKTVESMIQMLKRLIGEDIDLAWLPGKNLWPVKIDPSQIDQILANLCVNARDAIAGVGKVTIETGNIELDESYCADHLGFFPGEFALLAVSDNGCGMDAEIVDNIFEPFFTTKKTSTGTGLGLAMVYGVVKQNEGFINVYSEPGQGTTFRIYLPRYGSKTKALPTFVKDIPIKRGQETILLVEDEPTILKMTTMMLEKMGYHLLAAGTPNEAIRLAQNYTGRIYLLLTDVIMPEMNGRDLSKRIQSIHPNLKSLFMSGYTANVIAHHGVLDKGINFIQKPFSMETLSSKVREVLDGSEA